MSDPVPNAGGRLERMLAALPEDIEPRRDLWPDIAAQLEAGRGSGTRRWMWQLAAGLVLGGGHGEIDPQAYAPDRFHS